MKRSVKVYTIQVRRRPADQGRWYWLQTEPMQAILMPRRNMEGLITVVFVQILKLADGTPRIPITLLGIPPEACVILHERIEPTPKSFALWLYKEAAALG